MLQNRPSVDLVAFADCKSGHFPAVNHVYYRTKNNSALLTSPDQMKNSLSPIMRKVRVRNEGDKSALYVLFARRGC